MKESGLARIFLSASHPRRGGRRFVLLRVVLAIGNGDDAEGFGEDGGDDFE